MNAAAASASGRTAPMIGRSRPDRLQLVHLAERVRSGRLKPIIGAVRPLAEATAAFTPDRRIPGKTIIRVTEGE